MSIHLSNAESAESAFPLQKQMELFPMPPGYHIIFRPFITLKNGHRLYAKQCGKRAFPILVKDSEKT